MMPSTNNRLDNNVRSALEYMLRDDFPVQTTADIIKVFTTDTEFLPKVNELDAMVNKHPELTALGEILFDLMLVNFLSVDAKLKSEDYLESAEWMEIEERTIERGTELLNIFLFIQEAKDDDVDITLENFLNDFLLVHEDEHQDEFRIYEDLIKNAELANADLKQIGEVSKSISDESEMKELFLPIMAFFLSQNESVKATDLLSFCSWPDFEIPAFKALQGFNSIQ